MPVWTLFAQQEIKVLPTRLELSNFKSHTHSVIDFDFSSALIIGEKSGDPRRSNGSGKSSILESLSFALYGETGDKNADDVVKRGQVTCEVVLDFIHNEQKYQIKRTRNAKYSKMITEFWRVTEDGQREKLHGDTNKITDSIICETIKCTYDVFLNSVYFRQGSFFDFTQGTFSTRQALLGSLLNLEDWTKYQKVAKTRFDKLEGEIEIMRAQLLRSENAESSLRDSRNELVNVNAQIEALASDSAELEKQISLLEDAILSDSDKGRQATKIKELDTESSRLDKELSRLQSVRNTHDRTLTELNSSLASAQKAIEEKEAGLANLVKELASADLELRKADVSKMEASLVEGKAKTRQIRTQIETLTNGDKCTTCGHEWTDAASKQAELDARKAELATLLAKVQRAESKVTAAKGELERLSQQAFDLEKFKIQLANLNDGLNTLQLRITTTEGQRSALLEEILLTEKKLHDIRAALNSISNVEALDSYALKTQQLSIKKEELKSNRNSARELFVKSGQLAAQIEALQETLDARNKAMDILNECTKQATVYSRLTKAFGRDGVQAIIIDNVVDELTRATNAWLSEFSSEPMHISFVTQKQGTKGEWKETFDIEINTRNGPQPWHSLSGGEKFIVSFAIRLALGSIQARRMGGEAQLLLLDEVSSSLDPYNIDIFVTIIRKLERHMKILVITHDPALKDEFETIITVKRTHAGSEVEIS
jgi:exonuclease SbcC